MMLRAVALAASVAAALGGDVNIPKWPPTYNMSLSTIIMPVSGCETDRPARI
jgi:hypothetical protein